jgi:muconolactone delta-isomerase
VHILSQLLDYAESKGDCALADRIKLISPVSWKHVNFYGEYTFRDAGDIVDLDQLVSRLAALEWKNADAEQAD